MPGRFFLHASGADVAAHFRVSDAGAPELTPRANIAPGQEIAVLTESGTFEMMRWGIIPVGRVNARGRPVLETLVNVRGETLFQKSAFDGFRRAVVPVNGWYEWTGKTRRKTAWRIAPKHGGLLIFAAVWDVWAAPGGREVLQVATVTCPPNGDVEPIHHRMGVILEPENVETWLSGDEAEAQALVTPWPDGRLGIEEATNVDWSGA